jgi:uncharacterized circularly permuted ATP-grasp superfamily protein/uncharacterized alpha-E superfamily protein
MSIVETSASDEAHLLAGYKPAPQGFDEMLGLDGAPRAHWQQLLASFERWSSDDLAARRESAQRVLLEHGVTYNVQGDVQGLDRPWPLDLAPLVLPAAEWRALEAGLIQRVRLLNALLEDFYRPRRLLEEGIVPPALLHANPSFLRACHGIRPPRNMFLFFHAVDLARAPDGQWWVLSDRAQTPPGLGYALENRIVTARVLPDEFRDCRVHRLADFFQSARETLRSLAPSPRGQPNVALLTPGPYNEAHFEQALLARYLGFALVEGADLTVRERRVFIKTLEGLQPVDVLLRYVEDARCDPLQLRADSHLGTPGLVEAARAGNIALANALGSGVVEMPALMAFLPELSRRMLGEELKLPSVATWWCGQEKELGHVLEHLGDLVVKRAFKPAGTAPVFGPRLGEKERASLSAAIQAAPFDFVGQEPITFSTVPAWQCDRLEPRPMLLRAYVCATADGYQVMPGGLTRFSPSLEKPFISTRGGGGTKDTWVFTEGAVSQLSLLPAGHQVIRLERAAAEVPSRVADNLFWLGRYTERLEDTVRILRCLLRSLSSEPANEETPEVAALVRMLVMLELMPAKFRVRYTLAAVEREAYSVIYEVHRLGTVREVLGRLKSIVFLLRDRFSADTWRILSKLQVDAQARPGRVRANDTLALLNTLIVDLAAFSGMEMENMTRGHGWRFLDIGRRLERAVNITTLVQSGVSAAADGLNGLEPMLEIADSVMTYRRRYFAQPQWPAVLDLLISDDSNPRSLAFQTNALRDHAARLPRDISAGKPSREMHLAVEFRNLLGSADLRSMAEAQFDGGSSALSEFLTRITVELRLLSNRITHQYFSHADTRLS